MKNVASIQLGSALFISLHISVLAVLPAYSQSAVVTNASNPSSAVSTTTTGGTNINYQTNNQWSNEMGFAPGVFCRTPTFYVGAGTGQNLGNTMDTSDNGSSQYTHNYNANIGILVPFGSTVQRDCKRVAEQIAVDREISSDLSMIRACASLDSEGIIVDPDKFPTLGRCVIKTGQPPLTVARARVMKQLQVQQGSKPSQPLGSTPAKPKLEVIKD